MFWARSLLLLSKHLCIRPSNFLQYLLEGYWSNVCRQCVNEWVEKKTLPSVSLGEAAWRETIRRGCSSAAMSGKSADVDSSFLKSRSHPPGTFLICCCFIWFGIADQCKVVKSLLCPHWEVVWTPECCRISICQRTLLNLRSALHLKLLNWP